MARPPTLKRVNRVVGIFVLLAAVIILLSLAYAARVQRWFSPGKRIEVLLPTQGSFGLSPGADVVMLGAPAGRVLDVGFKPGEEGRMRAEIEIRSDFAAFVRQDSKGTIRKKFGVAGDAFMEVSRGHGAELPEKDATITSTADEVPTELLQVLVDELRRGVVPAVEEARVGIHEWTELGRGLRADDGGLMRFLAALRSVTEDIEQGRGTIGRLARDEELGERVERLVVGLEETVTGLKLTVENLARASSDLAEFARVARGESEALPGLTNQVRESLTRLDGLLGDFRNVLSDAPAMVRDLRQSAAALPALVLQAQETLREAERLIEGLQRHWLFRGSVPPEATPTLSPEEVSR